jgi:hypothetical protein
MCLAKSFSTSENGLLDHNLSWLQARKALIGVEVLSGIKLKASKMLVFISVWKMNRNWSLAPASQTLSFGGFWFLSLFKKSHLIP